MSIEKLITDLAIGDGYIQPGKSTNANACLVVKHSTKQIDYLLEKKHHLEQLGMKCSIDTYTDRKGYGICQLRTKHSHIVTRIRELLYPDGCKTIKNIIEKFDEESLAWLFQDDGGREHRKWSYYKGTRREVIPYINAFVLHVCTFSSEDCQLLQDKLLDMGIEARTRLRKGYHTMIVSKVESKKRFERIVKPRLHKSMSYKIDFPVSSQGLLTP